jgi:hypothetical protein
MNTTVFLALVVLGIVLIAAGVLLSWRRTSVRPAVGAAPSTSARPATARDEFAAAPASEAIEDLVNQRLAAIPGLAGTRVDFGTAADGSLEIWIGEERYTAVDQVRDPRIRQAIEEAVASYNK